MNSKTRSTKQMKNCNIIKKSADPSNKNSLIKIDAIEQFSFIKKYMMFSKK